MPIDFCHSILYNHCIDLPDSVTIRIVSGKKDFSYEIYDEKLFAQWSAALADEEQEQLAAEQASAGTIINWTVFDTGTVMWDDVTSSDATEHMNTWRVAYDLDSVREWLFEQSK